MKRNVSTVIVLVLVFGFLLANFSTAQARRIEPVKDPVVTSLTGDADFAVVLVDQPALPGAEQVNGVFLPIGFSGEKQFNGKAVVLGGAAYGSQKVCFDFAKYSFGWTGNVYQWTGEQWEKLATEIFPGFESVHPQACATVDGDGTYALLIGYTEPVKRVVYK